jgi:hypothetical protein
MRVNLLASISVFYIKEVIIRFYVEYVNNFLTIERMAEYFEMTIEDCRYLVELGKKYHNQ